MLAEFTSTVLTPSFWLTFLVISAIPYGMYLVAYLFESRRPGNGPNDIPIWKGQSRAFLPGDFGLALFVTAWLQYRPGLLTTDLQRVGVSFVSTIIAVLVYTLARKYGYKESDYTPEAWRSPTKVYHDAVMFGGFTLVAAFICLPVLFLADWSTAGLVLWLGLFGLAVWGLGNLYDFTHSETPNDRQHPSVWKPIWKS